MKNYSLHFITKKHYISFYFYHNIITPPPATYKITGCLTVRGFSDVSGFTVAKITFLIVYKTANVNV